MGMTDRIISLVAVLGLAFCFGILIYWVREIDMTIVLLVTIGLAFYDFFIYTPRNS